MRNIQVFTNLIGVKLNLKKALCSAALLGVIAIISGCQTFAPSVPPGVTFNNQQPRWSWTGTWRGNSGAILHIVQTGNQWVVSGNVSGAATLYGNRAVWQATDGVVPRTFDFVLSDDGMYAKGTGTVMGMTMQGVLTRISGPPVALANGAGQSEESGSQKRSLVITKADPNSPAWKLGLREGDVLELQENPSEAGNVVTIEQFQAWTHDNAYAAEQQLLGMGMVNIRGRVDRVSAKDITLVGDTEIYPQIVCQFRQLARSFGQPFSYATPAGSFKPTSG